MKFAGILTSIVLLSAVALGPAGTAWGQGADTSAADAVSRVKERFTQMRISRDDIAELMRVFLPDGTNEARLIDQVDATITKVVDLGFLRRLKPAAGVGQDRGHYEVRRILKAFVDAQWLAEFDARLEVYRTAQSGGTGQGTAQENSDA